ncbi:hypothetical protein EP7_002256 [Isosphaeraceae bacterium EP7]
MSNDDRLTAQAEPAPRSEARQFFALIVIGTATAMMLGMTLKAPTLLGANDISRWCTVWSLLERGDYVIDECPWVSKTQDKVKKPDKLTPPGADSGPMRRLEYAIAPGSWKSGEPTEHFYSSKPPLLPTLIAGVLYPIRKATGVPLDRVVEQKRMPRYVESPVEGEPGKTKFVLETPKEPVRWAVLVWYLKPIIILLNVVPMLLSLVLYARFLDREAGSDWAWMLSLAAGAFGTYLFVFAQTLNNHSIAAWSAFFALYAFQRIWVDDRRSGPWFAAAGFFGAFTACNELPAALFGALLFLTLLARFPGKTLKFFVPAAVVPLAAFLATQYLAFGQFTPVYEEFGTKSYTYEGSYWNTPLEFDWFNASTTKPDGTVVPNQEPHGVYLFHMTLGHHGVFSLTPIFLFSIFGAAAQVVRRGRLSALAWLTLALTVAMLAFYTWNPKARNYGGSTQGLRWLFWVIPFWLAVLPAGLEAGQRSRFIRGLSLAALCVSALSVGYACRFPWSHPWIVDLLGLLNLYPLVY